MANENREDPFRNFNFHVEVDGITDAGFTDCSGFGASTDPIEYREGGMNTSPRKLPGMTKYTNITLKWGITNDDRLYKWYRQIVAGDIQRKNGSIIVFDVDGVTEMARWNFFEAWPTKWDGADFSAKGNEVAIDTLELAVERIERA